MYCMNDSPAENMALIATPAKTIVSALTLVILVSSRIEAVARREKRKALRAVT